MKIRKQRGVAAIEFAIVAPLLFVLLFGIIEFSLILYDQAMITNASRQGARAGVLYRVRLVDGTGGTEAYQFTDEAIQAVVLDSLTHSDGSSRLISLGETATPTTTTNPANIIETPRLDPGQTLAVTVTYRYTFLVLQLLIQLPFVRRHLPGFIDLEAATVMVME